MEKKTFRLKFSKRTFQNFPLHLILYRNFRKFWSNGSRLRFAEIPPLVTGDAGSKITEGVCLQHFQSSHAYKQPACPWSSIFYVTETGYSATFYTNLSI